MAGSSRSKSKAEAAAASVPSAKTAVEEKVDVPENNDNIADAKENTSSEPSPAVEGKETSEDIAKEQTEKEQPKTKVCETMEELQALFNKFKNKYLPELESLYEDCSWLRVKLGLDTKKDMHPNELRLVQFTFLVGAVVHQIQRYKIVNGVRDSGTSLLSLEKKVVNEIFPLQAKLKVKFKQARRELSLRLPSEHQSKYPQPPGFMPNQPRKASGPSVEAYLDKPLNHLLGSDSDRIDFRNNNTSERQSWEHYDYLLPGNGMNSGDQGKRGIPHMQGNIAKGWQGAGKGGDGLPMDQSGPIMEDEYVSQRRRRRLSQIVPNPRKPKSADYICSICNEQYQQMVVENPWWTVAQQQCRKCNQFQIPRIDIMAEANAIEHDPNVQALYGEGLEDSGDDQSLDGDMHGDHVYGGEDEFDKGKQEHFGSSAEGFLERAEASKLLVLMCHARTCTGVHNSPKHAEICKSTKYLMLHIRDCNGMDIHGRPCRFPWCTPCKRMLEHLTHCYEPNKCSVCNPWQLPNSFMQLKSLNEKQDQNQPTAAAGR